MLGLARKDTRTRAKDREDSGAFALYASAASCLRVRITGPETMGRKMSFAGSTPRAIRFSTDDYAERDRIEALREVYGRTIVKHDIELLRDGLMRAEGRLHVLPGLGLAFGRCLGISRLQRTAAHIDSDDFVLTVSLGGGRLLSQRGREIAVARGQAVVASCAETGVVTLPSASRFISFRLPRKAVAPLIAEPNAHVAKLIPRNSEALQLLLHYVRSLQRHEIASPELQRLVVAHVYDLAALAIGATREAAAIASVRGVRDARLRAIKADIAESIGRRDLSIAAISALHGISPRSIQMLFEADGTTFTEFVLGQRLARAHRMLVNPRFADQAISAIAFDVGFGDLSYFNRAFRRRFGSAPSDVRAEARQMDRPERA
jgi:AraC-like DNA-binding protein